MEIEEGEYDDLWRQRLKAAVAPRDNNTESPVSHKVETFRNPLNGDSVMSKMFVATAAALMTLTFVGVASAQRQDPAPSGQQRQDPAPSGQKK